MTITEIAAEMRKQFPRPSTYQDDRDVHRWADALEAAAKEQAENAKTLGMVRWRRVGDEKPAHEQEILRQYKHGCADTETWCDGDEKYADPDDLWLPLTALLPKEPTP